MASVVLTVRDLKRFDRKSVNPETNEEKTWCECNVTTNEEFASCHIDENGIKSIGTANTFNKPASTIISGFEATTLGLFYTIVRGKYDKSDMELYAKLRAAEATAMLVGGSVVLNIKEYVPGDIYDDEVLDKPMVTKDLVTTIPSKDFLAKQFARIRENKEVMNTASILYDFSKDDDTLAEEWIAETKATFA